jgi:hypothetical protein
MLSISLFGMMFSCFLPVSGTVLQELTTSATITDRTPGRMNRNMSVELLDVFTQYNVGGEFFAVQIFYNLRREKSSSGITPS